MTAAVVAAIALFVSTVCFVTEILLVDRERTTWLEWVIVMLAWLCPAAWVLYPAQWLSDWVNRAAAREASNEARRREMGIDSM